jgi:[acyl-carrier-protein] S-malonyltransferase
MAGAGEAFSDLLVGTEFDHARIPVLQNTSPSPETDADIIRERLMAQITSPVRWTETMTALAANGPITLIEAGPGSVLSGLAKRVEGITAVAVETTELERIVEEVS